MLCVGVVTKCLRNGITHIPTHPVLPGKQPGDEAVPGWATQRRCAIAVAERETCLHESVQVRSCLSDRVTPHLVNDDEYNVESSFLIHFATFPVCVIAAVCGQY